MGKSVIEKVKELPNPDGVWFTKIDLITRQQCVEHCIGCQKMFSDEDKGDVCISYADPKIKWRSYKVEEVKIGDKSFELTLNPCPMATHIQHRPLASFFNTKGKLNPIKQSKRR